MQVTRQPYLAPKMQIVSTQQARAEGFAAMRRDRKSTPAQNDERLSSALTAD